METKITFKFLRELQKKERESSELQKLPDNFLDELREYVSRKRTLLENPEMLTFTERKEMENIKPVVRYIFDRREQKVVIAAIRAARTGIKPQNMLPHEEALFVKLRDEIKKNRLVMEEIISLLDGSSKSGASSGQPEIKEADAETSKGEEAHPEEAESQKQDEQSTRLSDEMKIEMIKDVPAFVGIDLKKYGPWKKGEILSVPRKIAEALIKTGRAREVE